MVDTKGESYRKTMEHRQNSWTVDQRVQELDRDTDLGHVDKFIEHDFSGWMGGPRPVAFTSVRA